MRVQFPVPPPALLSIRMDGQYMVIVVIIKLSLNSCVKICNFLSCYEEDLQY